MEITFLGTGAPLHLSRATTGMLVTADGCAPLLIDTCGGFELVRGLNSAGFPLAQIRNVIVTHRHFDHSGGILALFLANMPLDVHALDDTYTGICRVVFLRLNFILKCSITELNLVIGAKSEGLP